MARSLGLALALGGVAVTCVTAQVPVALAPAGAPTAPAIRVKAEPRSFRIVTVPVPVWVPADRDVRFEIVPTGAARIIGAKTGAVAPGVARGVVFTVGLPARARAGATAVARVRVYVAGAAVLEVPVELEVARVRGAVITLGRALTAGAPGDRIAVPYVVTNTGNATDSFALALALPAGWQARAEEPRYALEPDATAEGRVTIDIPRSASTGAARVRLVVHSAGGELARAEAAVEVLDPATHNVAYVPRLTAGTAVVVGDTGSPGAVVALQLDGQLGDQVRASGRLVEAVDRDHADTRALGRVGYFIGSPYLSLATTRWQATLGTTGVVFSDLAGVNLYGRGGSFSGTFDNWSVATLVARPASGPGTGGGGLLGARVGRRLGAGWLNVTATDLEDRQSTPRRLQAVVLGGTVPLSGGASVSAEIADRSYGFGHGLGLTTEFRRQVQTDLLLLRYTHAPGGSAAFARVRNELTAYATQALRGGFLLSAGLWTTEDESPVFSRLHSSGFSFVPQIAVDAATTAGVEARATSFEAVGGAGAFGNGERMVGVFANHYAGPRYATGSVSIGWATRTATTASGLTSSVGAGRAIYRGVLGWADDRGNFQVSASVEQNGAGAGLLPRQYVVGLRAERVPVRRTGTSVLLNAEAQHYGFFGDRPAAGLYRLGLTAPLPLSLFLTVDAERNPFALGPTGGSRWITVLKLERGVSVPVGALRPALQGAVYEDRNANGRRDGGEPGLAGVLLRRGAESAVTDRSGRFRFYDRTDAPAGVDETSLPFGMLVNAGTSPRGGERRVEVGVIPTAPVEVVLVAMPGEDGHQPVVDFSSAVVRARAARGDAWTARVDSAGLAKFYALPPGRYEIDLDLTGLSEPLQPRAPLPTFTVEIGREIPRLSVPVYPRRIRMRDGSRPGNRAGLSGEVPRP